jgi:hypothetical protein
MIHSPLRAEEYRTRAAAEIAAGDATSLEQVRAKHARAAQVWTDLADAEEARARDRAERQAAADALRPIPAPAD